ncbi:MAG: zonular occludens toxin domain-containing protein [Gallionella sp.]
MTDATLLTGKRGTGKSLNAVKTIQQYMLQGRIVATNLDLFIENLLPANSRCVSYRLPDVPVSELLNHPLFPVGNPNPVQEEKNGLLVLDECAGFLNSRDWKDKDRTALIHFLAQSRKFGWDLILIAQGASMIDKQIRTDLCDMHGVCRETSKIGIPFFTAFIHRTFGLKVMMPKFYIVNYYYGFGLSAVKSFSEIFRQSDVRHGYNTLQKISAELGQQGISSNLSSWHLKGRYMTWWQMMKKIIFVSLGFGFVFGLAFGFYFSFSDSASSPVVHQQIIQMDESVFVVGKMFNEGVTTVILSDGRMEQSYEFKIDESGTKFKVGGIWYKEKA